MADGARDGDGKVDGKNDGDADGADAEKNEEDERAAYKKSYFRKVYVPLPKNRFKYMSHAEISIVIRQQLQQLQTKNPMDDDFYYQVFTARQGISISEGFVCVSYCLFVFSIVS